jgi:two-component system, NtrC family, nitrogen regulation sensor histidine kinase NtrY
VNSLRHRLIAIFLLATILPLAGTVWIVRSLLEYSLSHSTTTELEEVASALEQTGRELYQRARENLKRAAESGERQPVSRQKLPVDAGGQLTPRVNAVTPSQTDRPKSSGRRLGANEQQANHNDSFSLEGYKLIYQHQVGNELLRYEEPLAIDLQKIRVQLEDARALIERNRERDLRRGLLYAFLAAAAVLWLTAFVALIYFAHRVSKPIHQLTGGLESLAAGQFSTRVAVQRDDEIGQAITSFNEMATQLEQSRERLLFLARLESWQALAKKMAHEVKNSLTPIRLTVEEMVARHGTADADFLRQAAQIVTDEVTTLERRVRAFSDFASEPPVHQVALDLNHLAGERIALLRHANPAIVYQTRLDTGARPIAFADEDLVRGLLTNLLENAAHAAGEGGVVEIRTKLSAGRCWVEVHDSGPGLSPHARRTLFEPTISFKKSGMGLGLSIARKSALLNGGDLQLIDGELGGAGFRLILPAAKESTATCEPVSPSLTTKKTSAVPSA